MSNDHRHLPEQVSAEHCGMPDVISTIVRTVADVRGLDPLDLEEPLYDAVDPEAIEVLCSRAASRPGHPSGAITFEWNQCLVEVTFDGEVTVWSGQEGLPEREWQEHAD